VPISVYSGQAAAKLVLLFHVWRTAVLINPQHRYYFATQDLSSNPIRIKSIQLVGYGPINESISNTIHQISSQFPSFWLGPCSSSSLVAELITANINTGTTKVQKSLRVSVDICGIK
jgi:hypothetical protein